VAKGVKDPFGNIRAEQEKRAQKMQSELKKKQSEPAPSLDFTGNIYQQKGVSAVVPLKPSAVAARKAELAKTNPAALYSPEMAKYAKAPQSTSPLTLKTGSAALGIGLLEGGMDFADKINPRNYLPQGALTSEQAGALKKKGFLKNIPTEDIVKKSFKASKPAGTYSKQVDTLPYDDTALEGLKDKAGLQGTLAENILYGIGKETPAIVASYGTVGAATKIPTIGKALTGAGKWTETGRRGVAAGALYTPISEEKPEVKDYLENMALFGLGDVAFMGAAHAIGKGVNKGKETLKGLKRSSTEAPPDPGTFGELRTVRVSDKPSIVDGEYSMTFNREPLALQEGTTPEPQSNIPNWEYWKPPRPMANEQLALPSGQEPLALPEGINWERGTGFPKDDYWFVDQYGVARSEPGTPLALTEGRTGQGSRFIRQDEGVIPRSDIGNPAYLSSLEKQYSDIINAEVASMKSELGGVESIPGRNIRVSANPAWYREFWQKHLRAPREGEYRDLAIKNLMEGNVETGEPTNEEFLAVLSELSRGQKLPEEWHGLQRSIRDTAAMREPELEPLVKEMQAEQTKVEPYGLTRDLSRLDEVENQARTGMADRAGFEQYEGVRFKRDKVQPMQEEVNAFVDEAMADRSQFKTLPLREVSQEEIKIIKELTKTDTSGYFHQLSNNDLWHGLKQHGNAEIEASKGQIPITAEDLKRIPEIIDSYDNITKGSTNKGVKSVIYSKRINGNICYVEVILPRKGVLRSKTMWKEPAAVVHAMPEASPHYTSETDLSANPSTELNISSEGTVGKTMWKEPTRGADAAQNAPVDLNVQNGSSLTASTKLSVTPKETVGNMQENIVKGKGDVKLKRDLNLTPEQQQDLTVLEEIAAQRKLGPFTINKVELAPEAMEKPDFKAAGDIAEKLGLRLVTYKGKGARGAQSGRTLYINEGIKDPVDYVFWHEVGHSMESTHGEHYNQLMSVALEHIGDVKGLEKHYGKFGYTAEDMPHELAADVFAEALSTPGFFGRVAEKAPELLKPLLEAIDSLITRVKSMVSKDDTVMPYLKNLEDLRARVRDEVAMPYFKDTMDEKRFVDTFGKQWQEPAAKAKAETNPDIRYKRSGSQDLTSLEQSARQRLSARSEARKTASRGMVNDYSPFDDMVDLSLIGAAKMQKGVKYGDWAKQMLSDQGQGIEAQLPYLWHRGQELIKTGRTVISDGRREVPVSLQDMNTARTVSTEQPSGGKGFKAADQLRGEEIPPVGKKGFKSADQNINKEQSESVPPLQTPEGQALLESAGIDPAKLKDIAGPNIYARDMWRNAERVFGDKFPEFKTRVLDPLEDAKANWVDHQRELTDRLYTDIVKGLGIKKGSRESELIQLYGEGGYMHWEAKPKNVANNEQSHNGWLKRLEKKYGKGNVTLTDGGAEVRRPFDYNDLVKEVGADRAADIVQAENWFRQVYDNLIDQVNTARQQIYPNAESKLAKIDATIERVKTDKTLFPNTAERNAELRTLGAQREFWMRGKIVPKRKDYFRHFQEMEGIKGVQDLFDVSAQISPELAGKSMYTRPKSKFHGFMQKRGMGPYKPDAVGGLLDYIPEATFAIHIDPQVATFRGLENELSQAMDGNTGINNFLTYLKYFADDVQGKTNPIDRPFQEFFGRKFFRGLTSLNSKIKSNAVLGNAGTMVSQVFNMPQGIAFAKQYSAPGLTRYITSLAEKVRSPEAFAQNNPMAQSRFLKERFSGDMYRRFDTKLGAKTKDVAVAGMEDVDRFATEFIWNSCYEKALNTKGVSDPVRYADFHTRKLVAGRGVGEVPIVQKSKIFQVMAPFQVEVGNLWHVMGDMAKSKDYAGLFLALPLSLWLFNRGSEKVKGSPVAFDPLQAIIDSFGIAHDEEDDKAYRIMGRLAGEVLGNIPLGQTIAASVFDEQERREFFGREDPTRYGSGLLVAKGLKDPIFKVLPSFGGQQLEKTLKGALGISEEGIYDANGKLKYPVKTDVANVAKGLVFGTSGFRETQPYYEQNRRPLSEKQTRQVDNSANRQETYDNIIRQRKMNSIMQKIKDIRKDKGLTTEEKRMRIGPLQQELRQIRTGE